MLIDDLDRHSESLFSKRTQLLSLWQEMADHFYPERADFTITRNLGTDFAAGLMTTYPLLARRDLGNSFSSMLRPAGKRWFSINVGSQKIGADAQRWLEWASDVQRRAMYDRKSNFVRATKEADHDFAAFGNAAITTEIGPSGNTLLYRAWHLRDVAWAEGPDSMIDCIYQKWKPSISVLNRMFPKETPRELQDMYAKDPFAEINCKRVVMSSEKFGDSSIKMPWVSVYYCCEPKKILEVVGIPDNVWTIPRWQTVSGSQYGHSPATVCALPDARLIQAMTRVILEAGEKFTNPPLVGVQEAVRGDVKLMAGGITWVDAEYDERLGEVLRPLTQDKSGVGIGIELRQDIQMMIREAFFLNKIEMPAKPQEMTAYEVSQRVSEYIRQALPLFEPMEIEYNGALCESTFSTLMRNGAFGSPDSIPAELRGRDIQFKFQSPLQAALDSEKMIQLQQAKSALAMVADIDQGSVNIINVRAALRDALSGAQIPASWMRSESEVADIEAQNEENQNAQMELAAMQQAAAASKDLAASRKISAEVA